MAGVGLGIGLGLSGGRRANKPPNPDDIIRYFKTQEDNILIDSISSNDAPKILPVSVFDGVDGVVDTDITFDFNQDFTYRRLWIADLALSLRYIVSQTINIGAANADFRILAQTNGTITVTYGGVDRIVTDQSDFNAGGLNEIAVWFSDVDNTLRVSFNGNLYEAIIGNKAFLGNATFVESGRHNGSNDNYGGFYQNSLVESSLEFENGTKLYIPLPHLSYGFDSSNNPIPLTVSGGVSLGYDINGSSYLQDKGVVVKSNGDIIPNAPTGQAAYPIVSGDTFIAGGGMMNLTDCLVRLYEVGDVDIEHAFFDKSNALIWKQTVRDSIYYDASNTGDWHASELKQQYIYDNIQDAYKYRWWSKINSLGVFKDLFLYPTSLSIDDAVDAGKYVGEHVLIPYQVTEGSYQVTEGDYLVTP